MTARRHSQMRLPLVVTAAGRLRLYTGNGQGAWSATGAGFRTVRWRHHTPQGPRRYAPAGPFVVHSGRGRLAHGQMA